MRYTLTVGLLVCMPAVALLAVAGVAVLCGNVRHRLGQAVDHPRPERGTARASVSGLQFAPGPHQDQLERDIGNDDIYLVVAASGSSGYNAAMRQIISTLGAEKKQFVVGFLDSRLKHFGADNRGVLPSGAAANIATTVVQQHQSDKDIFAAMQDFVRDVQQESQAPGSSAAAASPPAHTPP